jgi:hypothetical protein
MNVAVQTVCVGTFLGLAFSLSRDLASTTTDTGIFQKYKNICASPHIHLPLSELVSFFMNTDMSTTRNLLDDIDMFCQLHMRTTHSGAQSIIFDMMLVKRRVARDIETLYCESMENTKSASLHDSRHAVVDIIKCMNDMQHNAMMNNTMNISRGIA